MTSDHTHAELASHDPVGGVTVPGPVPIGGSRRVGVLGLLLMGPAALGADLAIVFVPEPLLAVVVATACAFLAFIVIFFAALAFGGAPHLGQTTAVRSLDALSPAAPLAVAIAFAPIGLMGRGLPHVWILWLSLSALVVCAAVLMVRRRRLIAPSRTTAAPAARASIDS